LCIGILVAVLAGLFGPDGGPVGPDVPPIGSEVRPNEAVWAAYQAAAPQGALKIVYPFDQAVFPPGMPVPTFRWNDDETDADTWLVSVEVSNGQRVGFFCGVTEFTPSEARWETIQGGSVERPAKVTVVGVKRGVWTEVLSGGSITVSTSKDEVGAPLFYREVDLPFVRAMTDLSRARWRFGRIDGKEPPPVVLHRMPVCGSCHSFSAGGDLLGMDVDFGNRRGSYAIAPIAEETVLDKDNVIAWSDFEKEEAGKPTLGLFSRVSPDGRYVVTTVSDRLVFTPTPQRDFSPLLFPVQGILAVYRRDTGETFALPGADDPRYVQSNPTWSPDGKTIVFARSEALDPETTDGAPVLSTEESREFVSGERTFLFDLYRIPFNEGNGGKAEPVQGASDNGMSNYFPAYSPDGKWIVFCQAETFMSLQPDSELYIIPAAGGQARRMRCNTDRMNSWHSWSPNSRWLVFSSKVNGPYTQLLLAHVDAQGRSSSPVVLSHLTAPDRAANLPEFVNTKADAIKRIREQFMTDSSYVNVGDQYLQANNAASAEWAYGKALEINPNHALAHAKLGELMVRTERVEAGSAHFDKAVKAADPEDAPKYLERWAVALIQVNNGDEAVKVLKKAIEMDPELLSAQVHLGVALVQSGQVDQGIACFQRLVAEDPKRVAALTAWGGVLFDLKRYDEAIERLEKALEVDPQYPPARYLLARALVRHGGALAEQGKYEKAIADFRKAMEMAPDNPTPMNNLAWVLATAPKDALRDGTEAVKLAARVCKATRHEQPTAMDTLAAAYAEAGRFSDAVDAATKALELAKKKKKSLVEDIRARLELYKAGKPYRE